MLRIKELRLEQGLTQKDLAQKIGSTDKSIWAYEKGIAVPPLDVLIKLGDFFECSIDYIANRSDDFGNVVVQGSPTAELDAGEKDLLKNFRKLPEDLRHRAQAYMKKLVELTEEEISDTFARR